MKNIELLEKFGLEKKEAEVYISCLQLGNSSAFDIAHKAGFPKSSVHDILKSLNRKGFVSTYKKKNKKFFAPTSPEIIREKQKVLNSAADSLVPELEALTNIRANKPTVRFYENEAGVEVLLREMKADTKEVLVISANGPLFNSIPKYFPDFILERVKAGIRAKSLYFNDKEGREAHLRDVAELRVSKVMANNKSFTPSVWIWKNKVVFVNTKGSFSVLIIEDSEIAEVIRMMHESMWTHEPEVK